MHFDFVIFCKYCSSNAVLSNVILNLYSTGYGSQSTYNAQGGQSYGANPAPYHPPVGYGRGDPSMNYQYR